MHQEDHDTGFEENNVYWGNFLRSITEPVTYATINEIAAWLNLKYNRAEHPAQCVLAHDELACPDAVQWVHGVVRPDDWGVYPPHIFYYDRDVQLAAEQGKRIPCRVFDYQKNISLAFGEIYPEEELPEAAILSESLEGGIYTACIRVDRAYRGLPLAIEYADREEKRHCQVIRVDLACGEQTVSVRLDSRAAVLL